MIFAVPGLFAVTIGGAGGWVAPAGIVVVAGEIIAVNGSLLESVTIVPPGGAAVLNAMGRGPDWPRGMLMLVGMVITPRPTLVNEKFAVPARPVTDATTV